MYYKLINFAVQFCGPECRSIGIVIRETEVEKFGCLQPLKKMLKSHHTDAAPLWAAVKMTAIHAFI